MDDLSKQYRSEPLPRGNAGAINPSEYKSEPLPLIRHRVGDDQADAFRTWYGSGVGSINRAFRSQGGSEQQPLLESGKGPESHDPTKQSMGHAIVSLMKAAVGAGSFALPAGFLKGGLWASFFGLIFLGFVCAYSLKVLIFCKNKLQINDRKSVSYVDIVRELLGPTMGTIMYASIVILSIGACAAYLVFCSQMLISVWSVIDRRIWILILAAPLILLSWLRSFKYLAYTSILGDLAVVIAVVALLYYGFDTRVQDLHSPFDTEAYPPIRPSFPQFFGPAFFLFAIHIIAVPIEQSMQNRKQFGKAVNISFVLITILNLVLATLSYMLWGNETQSIIINNIPMGTFASVARVALVVDLFFTFLVVIVPAREILEESMLQALKVKRDAIPRIVFRSILIGAVMGIAFALTDSFQSVVDLISGLSLSVQAFILPPLIRRAYYKKFASHDKKGDYTATQRTLDVLIFIFGVLIGLFLTYSGVIEVLTTVFGINPGKFSPANWGK